MREIRIDNIRIGNNKPFVLIAGPCVIEERGLTLDIAGTLREMALSLNIPLIFKASYDKANRTSIRSFRGPGIEEGLDILMEVKNRTGLPVLTDVHCRREIDILPERLDVIQIPAFLSRQTDLIIKAASRGKALNIKKGQFASPWDMKYALEKALSTGNQDIMVTERGTTFGYHDLVADMRSIVVMREFGWPVIFDISHSVQRPGEKGGASGGDRQMIPCLARAATAAGVDGIYVEVHPEPHRAKSDGPNSYKLNDLPGLLSQLLDLDRIVKENL